MKSNQLLLAHNPVVTSESEGRDADGDQRQQPEAQDSFVKNRELLKRYGIRFASLAVIVCSALGYTTLTLIAKSAQYLGERLRGAGDSLYEKLIQLE